MVFIAYRGFKKNLKHNFCLILCSEISLDSYVERFKKNCFSLHTRQIQKNYTFIKIIGIIKHKCYFFFTQNQDYWNI